MIQKLLDTWEHNRLLVGLGITSIGQRWMRTLTSRFALAMYVNVIRSFGIRSMDSLNP